MFCLLVFQMLPIMSSLACRHATGRNNQSKEWLSPILVPLWFWSRWTWLTFCWLYLYLLCFISLFNNQCIMYHVFGRVGIGIYVMTISQHIHINNISYLNCYFNYLTFEWPKCSLHFPPHTSKRLKRVVTGLLLTCCNWITVNLLLLVNCWPVGTGWLLTSCYWLTVDLFLLVYCWTFATGLLLTCCHKLTVELLLLVYC